MTASDDPTPVAQVEGLEDWITLNFGGRGRAIRSKQAEPYPGEPYMSMAEAKELTRQAVAEFAAPPEAQTEGKLTRLSDFYGGFDVILPPESEARSATGDGG